MVVVFFRSGTNILLLVGVMLMLRTADDKAQHTHTSTPTCLPTWSMMTFLLRWLAARSISCRLLVAFCTTCSHLPLWWSFLGSPLTCTTHNLMKFWSWHGDTLHHATHRHLVDHGAGADHIVLLVRVLCHVLRHPELNIIHGWTFEQCL